MRYLVASHSGGEMLSDASYPKLRGAVVIAAPVTVTGMSSLQHHESRVSLYPPLWMSRLGRSQPQRSYRGEAAAGCPPDFGLGSGEGSSERSSDVEVFLSNLGGLLLGIPREDDTTNYSCWQNRCRCKQGNRARQQVLESILRG